MRTLLISFVLLMGTVLGFAQQIELTGQISLHNSRYRTGEIEYVPGASVEAPFAGASISDSQGLFSLTFQGIEEGTTIRLGVEKAGLEIVNRQDLHDVVLGRLQPLQIFLAPKGQLAEAQIELFNISKSALLRRHNQQIALLQKTNTQSDSLIQNLELKLNAEIANRYEAEELLNQQLAEVQRRLPAMARKLASVNLDFVSDMYRTAYEYLLEGEIELAIETLDEAVLDEEARKIIERIQISREGLDSLESAKEINLDALDTLIQSQVLQARILAQEEKYLLASNAYQEALRNLQSVTRKEEYPPMGDFSLAALLALVNEEVIVACALFEQALNSGPLEFPPIKTPYQYDEAIATQYLQIVRKIKPSNR